MGLIKATVSGPHLKPNDTGDSTKTDPRYQYDYQILCEGDSWMSIGEATIGAPNLLTYLEFQKHVLLWNLASPGHTLKLMANWCGNEEFLKHINGNEEFPYRAIFLSAGGNDLIDAANKIIVPASSTAGSHVADYINVVRLNSLFYSMLKDLRKIESARNSSKYNKYTPIVVHCYDYAVPGNAPVKFLGKKIGGPWLYPAVNGHVPKEHWTSIAEYLIDAMGQFFLRVQNENLISNFHVIWQTLNVLESPRWEKPRVAEHWANEIHPNEEGYRKLAPYISEALWKIAF